MKWLLRKILSLGLVKRTAPFFLRKKGKPLYAGFIIHSEMVQDKRVFEKLMELGAWLTFRPALCVMTPRNPYIKDDMEKNGITEEGFAARLNELKNYYEIGFHGHWCVKDGSPNSYNRDVPTRIEKAGFSLTLDDPEAIEVQFKKELEYFKAYGFTPVVYSAGWWFLNETVVKLLDSHGFLLDCSARHGYTDSFGGRYIDPAEMKPFGKPFRLKPSKKVIECANIFYLHSNWWTLFKELSPLLSSGDGPRSVVLPLHDYDLIEHLGKVKENIALIARIKNVRWTNTDGLISELEG